MSTRSKGRRPRGRGSRGASSQTTRHTGDPAAAGTSPVDVSSQAFKDAVASAVREAIPAIVDQVKTWDRSQTEEAMIDDAVDQHVQQLVAPQPHARSSITQQSLAYPGPANPQGTGEHGPPQNALATPDIESGIPIDYHLSQKTKDLISSHSFVEFSALLKKNPDSSKPKSFALKIQDDQFFVEGQSDHQMPQSINLWVSQFAIYSTVMLRAHPEQAIPLFHYMEHIRSLNATGYDWSKYDQAFRKLHASNPSQYPFDRDLVVLQLKCQTKPTIPESSKKHENKRMGNFQSSQHRKKERLEPPFPFGTCWTYQRGEYCPGCEWKEGHKCCYCGGRHAGCRCSQRPNAPQLADTKAQKQNGDPDTEPRPAKPRQTRAKSQ